MTTPTDLCDSQIHRCTCGAWVHRDRACGVCAQRRGSHTRMEACADCNWHRPIQARGLCDNCYRRHRYHGTHIDFPPHVVPVDDWLDDYEMLRREGYNLRQIAERFGWKFARLDRALTRHRDDPRAARPWTPHTNQFTRRAA